MSSLHTKRERKEKRHKKIKKIKKGEETKRKAFSLLGALCKL